ncbi:5'-methylthioadenosine/S-adenosylhomocysteine nucleosidase [Saccharobesus litoralis]|uniref:5'-methylthioadenosine/S-adenosylhomocysteine nucleosidase n=1 Tax=Saccharobesus litoralis TaxID=2172099 RepID=A0A2S0VW36_9ALTE|nr:5'-methylthioadenosine/S-adenosylhomocysteine nucleosidase [Saccharobesus litoralis]AWB68393.1 5'-methylthioadenosine/S-adenosylhomocysteine nucleosidase [Saccharobesus litoralis]
MTIAIIGAMQQEIEILRQQLDNCQEDKHGPVTLFCGFLAGHKVVLVLSGVGKTAAAMATTLVIDRYKPKFVINTGSAGGYASDLNIGDLVISSEVRHHDVDLTAFGFAMGQGFGFPESFHADPALIDKAQQAASKQPELQCKVGLICSGDSFMDCPERVATARRHFPDMIAVEMEAAPIAQVCQQFQTPFVVIRALSDIAGKESHQSFDSFLAQAAQHSSKLVVDFLESF